MKFVFVLACAVGAFSFDALAQPVSLASAQVTGAPDFAMTKGEVRKVDREAGKVTLRHEALKNLDMPGMTMVFRVSDPKFLDTLKVGDKVSFVAQEVSGQLTITAIETAK